MEAAGAEEVELQIYLIGHCLVCGAVLFGALSGGDKRRCDRVYCYLNKKGEAFHASI